MMSREVLEDVAEGWAEDIAAENVVHRDLSGIAEKTINQEEITVIKGVRRAGKTFMLYELFKRYGGTYINFEDDRLFDFSLEDFEKVYDMVSSSDKRILYLDEVQNVPGWEKFAHRTHRKIKFFVTGSNSALLGSDYARSLVGRTKSFTASPLSYSEFLRFKKSKQGRNSLMDYMDIGGFPRVVITGDRGLAREYLDRIIYRDILGRENVLHPEALKTLAIYLLSNVGKEFSYRSLKKVCSVKHENTIKDYIGLLKEAFLVDVVNKFHPSLKTQESYGKKVYSIDPAFIGQGKRVEEDHGRILENMVYIHLRTSSRDIYFGKNGKEVDFVVCRGLKPEKVINVTYRAEEKKTLQREVSSLEYFMEDMRVPGALVSLYPCTVPDGIEFHLAHRFLKEIAQPIAQI